MYCRKCGNELAEGSEFCSKCGTPVKEKEKSNVVLWILFSFFALATLLCLIRIEYGNLPQLITYGISSICLCPEFIKAKNFKWYIRLIIVAIIIGIGSSFFTIE